MSQKIGFIGLGIMGQPMATNILGKGYELMVYNRTEEKTKKLVAAGALKAETPAQLADWADIIILMLTGPEAIDAMLNAADGLMAADTAGKVVINMSTVAPSYTRRLKMRLETAAVIFLDAPVSGSKKPAVDGTLIILAGGPEKTIRELEPLLLCMGQKIVFCGKAGQGSALKMTINHLLAVMMEGLCETLNLAQQLSLENGLVLDALLAGPLGCGLFNLKKEMLERNEFPVQFPLKHMTKDLRFVLQSADEAGAPVPAAHAAYQVYRQAVGRGDGDLDFAAVKRTLTALNDQPS